MPPQRPVQNWYDIITPLLQQQKLANFGTLPMIPSMPQSSIAPAVMPRLVQQNQVASTVSGQGVPVTIQIPKIRTGKYLKSDCLKSPYI